MSFREFLPDVEQLAQLLVLSHQSSGKTVAITRNKNIWVNLSAKSTINEWKPRHRFVQKSFLDVVGSGDGGKLGAFMTISLIRSLAKHKHGGHPELTQEILSHVDNVTKAISEYAQESEVRHMAQIAQDLDFAEQLAEAVMLGGVETHISLEKYEGTGVEVIESESFISEAKTFHLDGQVSLKGAMVALLAQRLTDFDQVKPVLEEMGAFQGRPLVVIAPMMRGQALATLKKNRDEGVVEAYGVEVPLVTWGKGWLEDVASFTGGKVFDPSLEKFSPQHFGSAREILLKLDELVIDPYDDHAEITAERISQLLHEAKISPHPFTQDLWRKRASALAGSLIRVKIGGVTEGEARLRRNKAEKHLISMESMARCGHITGAIPTLFRTEGFHPIVDRALKAPLRVVALNKGSANLEEISKLDALQDPFPAERLIELVRNSFSIATLMCSVARIIKSKR